MNLLFQTPRAQVGRVVRRITGAPSPLSGRTVLVPGASSGIGEATALAAARAGATVLLVARRAEQLDVLQGRIQREGGTAYVHPCDLTDARAVDVLIDRVLAEHGAVDYLVNNAGRSIRRSLELSYDRLHDFERTMAINYFGPVRLTMGLLPAMRAQKFGHIVNIVTWGVQAKAPKFAAYIASKTALDTFGRIVGREAFFDNVGVTNIRLSLVHTEMSAPTEAYAGARGFTPEQAAAKVIRALEDRPITIDVPVARIAEVLNLAVPRVSDLVMALADKRFPDSAAARQGASAEAGTSTGGRAVRRDQGSAFDQVEDPEDAAPEDSDQHP